MPDRAYLILAALWLSAIVALASSEREQGTPYHRFTVTAYCSCSECCGWERGSWKFLKIDVWNRYVAEGERAGRHYDGRTASGTKPHAPRPGLFSMDSLKSPWMIPPRIAFFPWLAPSRQGTIAADTAYYPFGTRMYVEGYGWGVVEDRGSAIKGPDRIDLYMPSHGEALRWGRKQVMVEVRPPGAG